MSRPFAKNNGKTAFGQFIEPLNASEYISIKKTKATTYNVTPVIANSNLVNPLDEYTVINSYTNINTSNLYINLMSKIDLHNVVVISDLGENTNPVAIDTNVIPYLKYNIDPSGNLFGETVCGIDNYENYIIYNSSC